MAKVGRMKGNVITATVELTQGYVAVIDVGDVARVAQQTWSAHVARRDDGSIKNVYAVTHIVGPGGVDSLVRLHHYILDAVEGVPVDHKDGNGLDNRRSNLRLATHSQNGCNRRAPKNNRSGYKGVSFESARGQWKAKICSGGKQRHLGLFPTAEDAARAYDSAAIELHGEFAHLNLGNDETCAQ
jgi:hypothetical protein